MAIDPNMLGTVVIDVLFVFEFCRHLVLILFPFHLTLPVIRRWPTD